MAHLALYSFSPGMTPEQQQALISGQREPEEAAPQATAKVPQVRLRRRAHTGRGTFQADDPATPAVNEAYEGAPDLRAEAKPGREN
jgi:hypothetical protein